jgi:hypothetical protein
MVGVQFVFVKLIRLGENPDAALSMGGVALTC